MCALGPCRKVISDLYAVHHTCISVFYNVFQVLVAPFLKSGMNKANKANALFPLDVCLRSVYLCVNDHYDTAMMVSEQ
jgi:hypothetical protein